MTTLLPSVLDDGCSSEILHLSAYGELAQAIEFLGVHVMGSKFARMSIGDVTNGLQPVIHDAMAMPIQRRFDAAAAVVPAQE